MSPNKARCPGASLLVVLAILCLAGTARSAEYSVKPEVRFEQNFDDNVQGVDNRTGGRDLEISSWNTLVTPIVTLGAKSDKSEASLFLGTQRRKTYSLSELDGSDERVEATLRRALSPRVSVGARAKYEFLESYDPIEEAQTILFAERPDLRWRSAGGDVLWALDGVTQLKLDVETSDRDYDETTRPDLYDTENDAAELTLSRQLSAADKIGAILGLAWSEETSVESPAGLPETRTEDTLFTYLGFWERNWSQKWTTTLQAGARNLETDREDPNELIPGSGIYEVVESSDSSTGFVGGASAVYTYSPRGALSVSYVRDTRTGTSSATGSSAIDIDVYSATLRHRVAERLTLALRGAYTRYETTGDSQVPDYFFGVTSLAEGSETKMRSLELRLDYQLRKQLTAYASFRYFDYDDDRFYNRTFGGGTLGTTVLQRDYERRIFAVGVRYWLDLLDREP